MKPKNTQDVDNYYANPELMINALNSIRRIFLDEKPHVKEYYKIRDMHSEIINTMIQFYQKLYTGA